jgi:hypothetical protein
MNQSLSSSTIKNRRIARFRAPSLYRQDYELKDIHLVEIKVRADAGDS